MIVINLTFKSLNDDTLLGIRYAAEHFIFIRSEKIIVFSNPIIVM